MPLTNPSFTRYCFSGGRFIKQRISSTARTGYQFNQAFLHGVLSRTFRSPAIGIQARSYYGNISNAKMAPQLEPYFKELVAQNPHVLSNSQADSI